MLLTHPSEALAKNEERKKKRHEEMKNNVVHLNQISPERLADVMRGSKSMLGHNMKHVSSPMHPVDISGSRLGVGPDGAPLALYVVVGLLVLVKNSNSKYKIKRCHVLVNIFDFVLNYFEFVLLSLAIGNKFI